MSETSKEKKEKENSKCSITSVDSDASTNSYKGGTVDTELLKKIFAKVQDPQDWVDCSTVRIGKASDCSSSNDSSSSGSATVTPGNSDTEHATQKDCPKKSLSKSCTKLECKDVKMKANCPCKLKQNKKCNSSSSASSK